MKRNYLWCATLLLAASCVSSSSSPFGNVKDATDTEVVTVQLDKTYQTIDGFGGSNAWSRLDGVPDEVFELLFSQTKGIGLTILRNRIPFRDRLVGDDHHDWDDNFIQRKDDNTYVYTTGANGVKTFALNWDSWDLLGTKGLIDKINAFNDGPEKLTLMSSPWTPPNNRAIRWKPNVKNWATPDIGGSLDPARYADYADLLADYALGFEKNMGAPLEVLSVQNEPNWEPDYESCKWTGEQMRDFIKILGQRFALKGVKGVKILAPEDENLKEDMVKPMLADADAAAVLSVIGLHQYEGAYDESGKAGAEELPAIWASGKRLWETEVSGSGPKMPRGDGIENALFYAKMIHYDMTLAKTNAFLYWWLWQKHDGKSNPGSLIQISNGAATPSKRLYALGQFSRFVRPGWVCVDASPSVLNEDVKARRQTGLYISAYRSADSSRSAIVLVNATEQAHAVPLAINGANYSSYEIYRTSETEDLKQIGKTATLDKAYLPPMSVTTVYAY